MNQHPKNESMHPEDMRNMLLFFVLALGLYLAYNHFVVKPRAEALQKAEQAGRIEKLRDKSVENLKTINELSREEALNNTASNRVQINAPRVSGSVNLQGARLDDLVLSDYYETLEKKNKYALLSPEHTHFPRSIEHGWLAKNASVTLPNKDTQWTTVSNNILEKNSPLILTWTNPQNIRFEREISIDDNFMFTVKQRVVNTSNKDIILYPYAKIGQIGIPTEKNKRIAHEGMIGYVGDTLNEITYNKVRKKEIDKITADKGWIGITEKYWMTSVIPEQGKNATYNFKYNGTPDDKDNTGYYQVDYVGDAITIPAGQQQNYTSRAFVGAKEIMTLRHYRDNLNITNFDLALDFGMWWILSKPFSLALHFLDQWVGNMGVAIIILTLVIRSSVFPLTNKSYKSFAKMKKVNPQISELREKYGEDKVVLQQKIMELYQKEGVNPMSGCLPLLLQIPIFFALYKTFFVTIEMRHAPFVGWIKDLSAADPTTVFNLFGLLPWNPPAPLMIGVWPCLMMITMLIQRRLNPPPQDPIQRDMMRWFPFIMTFVMSKFAAGLVIYWTFSAAIGITQQIIIMRSLGVPIYLFGESEEDKKLDQQIVDGPSGIHPLIEMTEEEVEKAMFGDDEDDEPKQISPPKPKKKTNWRR